MHCKVCDYRLWNLKARQCPECGTPFTISDYDFIPNTVQFCCPDCGQAYYGTAPNGHLVPEAFVCVRCGLPLHMNSMVLLPTEGIDEEQTEPQHMPWLDRERYGWWRSWLSTVKMALIGPGQLMRNLPANSPAGSAWWFAMVTLGLLVGVGVAVILGIMLLTGALSGGPAAGAWGVPIVAISVSAVAVVVMLGVWAAVTHLVLRITGGTRYGFSRTCEAVCYSAGTNVLLLVPLCGLYFYWIWWLVSASLMLRERQQVHGLRATLALMTLPVLLGVGMPLTIWGLSTRAASRGRLAWTTRPAASAPAPGSMPPPMQTLTIAGSLYQYALHNSGRGPRHVAELVGGDLTPQSLLLPGSATAAANIPIGTVTLEQLGSPLPDRTRAAAIDAAIASLPRKAAAYRLGDFVFTYTGMDFHRSNRRLWTAIGWPDPDANGGAAPEEITVGLLDGTFATFPASQWKAQLFRQNTLRAQNGLPPLPEPGTVHQARPPAEEE